MTARSLCCCCSKAAVELVVVLQDMYDRVNVQGGKDPSQCPYISPAGGSIKQKKAQRAGESGCCCRKSRSAHSDTEVSTGRQPCAQTIAGI